MKNIDLIKVLEALNPDEEFCIEISECNSDKILCTTYAVGLDTNELNELVLKVEV